MDTTKCIVCGKELPMDMTQIVIKINGNYVSACMNHEGSKELRACIDRLKLSR